jgi:hypothetical protein
MARATPKSTVKHDRPPPLVACGRPLGQISCWSLILHPKTTRLPFCFPFKFPYFFLHVTKHQAGITCRGSWWSFINYQGLWILSPWRSHQHWEPVLYYSFCIFQWQNFFETTLWILIVSCSFWSCSYKFKWPYGELSNKKCGCWCLWGLYWPRITFL